MPVFCQKVKKTYMYSYHKCIVLRSYFCYFLLWSTSSKGRPGHVPRHCGYSSISTQAQNVQQCNMRYPTPSTSFMGVFKWSAFRAVTFAIFKVETLRTWTRYAFIKWLHCNQFRIPIRTQETTVITWTALSFLVRWVKPSKVLCQSSLQASII